MSATGLLGPRDHVCTELESGCVVRWGWQACTGVLERSMSTGCLVENDDRTTDAEAEAFF